MRRKVDIDKLRCAVRVFSEALDECTSQESAPPAPPKPKCRAWIKESGALVLGDESVLWILTGGLDLSQRLILSTQINALILAAIKADREALYSNLSRHGLSDTAQRIIKDFPPELPE